MSNTERIKAAVAAKKLATPVVAPKVEPKKKKEPKADDKPNGPAQTPPNPESKTQLKKAGKLSRFKGETDRGRLPHGSTFTMVYDAERVLWAGTLVIEGQTYTAEKSGLLPMIRACDDQYREALSKQGKGEPDGIERTATAVHPGTGESPAS